jgi:hypothetical protein
VWRLLFFQYGLGHQEVSGYSSDQHHFFVEYKFPLIGAKLPPPPIFKKILHHVVLKLSAIITPCRYDLLI